MSDLTYCIYTEKITSAGIIVPMLACCHSNDDSYKDTVHLTGQQYEKLAATVMDSRWCWGQGAMLHSLRLSEPT